jgi:hypothetical protein
MTARRQREEQAAAGYVRDGYDPETAARIAAMDIALGALADLGWAIDAGSADPQEGAWVTSPAGTMLTIAAS